LSRTATGLGVKEGQPLLNVAGPREKEAPGIYDDAGRFLEKFLRRD
jgi:hypothetical protein